MSGANWPDLLSQKRYVEVCSALYKKHDFKGTPVELYKILSPEEKIEWLEAVLLDASDDLSYAYTILSDLSSRLGGYGGYVLRSKL